MASLFQSHVLSNNLGGQADSAASVDSGSLQEDQGEDKYQACESGVYRGYDGESKPPHTDRRGKRRQSGKNGRTSSRRSKRQKTPTRTLIDYLQNLVDSFIEIGKSEALGDKLDGVRGAVFALRNCIPSTDEVEENTNNFWSEKDVADIWEICCKCWEKSTDKERESEGDGQIYSLEEIANDLFCLIDRVPKDEKAAAQRCTFFLKMGRFHSELNDFENCETCLSKARRNAIGLEEIVNEWSMPEKQQNEYLVLLFEIFEESTLAAWKSDRKALACNTLSRLRGWAGNSKAKKSSTAGWMCLKLARLLLKRGDHCLPAECIALLTDAYEFLEKIKAEESVSIDLINEVKETETKVLLKLAENHLREGEGGCSLRCLKAANNKGVPPNFQLHSKLLLVKSLFALQQFSDGKTAMLEVFDHKETTERDCMDCLQLLVEGCENEKTIKEAALYAVKTRTKENKLITDIISMLLEPMADFKGSETSKYESLERVALEIVGDEFVLSRILQTEVETESRKSIFQLLWHRGSGHFFSKRFSEAHSVLSAALMYASDETKPKTARLLSLSNAYAGNFDKAQDYALMAEIGEPRSVLTAMTRLKINLARSQEEAASREIEGLRECQDFHPSYLKTAYEESVAQGHPKLAKQAIFLLRAISEKEVSQSDMAVPQSVMFQKLISAILASNKGIFVGGETQQTQRSTGRVEKRKDAWKGDKTFERKEIATEIRLVLKRLHAVGKGVFFGKDPEIFEKRVCWFGDVCTRLGHSALVEKDWENALVLTQGAIRFYSLLEQKTIKEFYLHKKMVCFESTICCLLKLHDANPTKQALLAMAKKMMFQLKKMDETEGICSKPLLLLELEFEVLCRMQDSKGAEAIAEQLLKHSDQGVTSINFESLAQSWSRLHSQSENMRKLCRKISNRASTDYSSKVMISSILSAKDDRSRIDSIKRAIQNAETCVSMDLSPLAVMINNRARVLRKRGLIALANEYSSLSECITSQNSKITHNRQNSGRKCRSGGSTGIGELQNTEGGVHACGESEGGSIRVAGGGDDAEMEGEATVDIVEDLEGKGLQNAGGSECCEGDSEMRKEIHGVQSTGDGDSTADIVGCKKGKPSSTQSNREGEAKSEIEHQSKPEGGSDLMEESIQKSETLVEKAQSTPAERGTIEQDESKQQCASQDSGMLDKSIEKNPNVVETTKRENSKNIDGMISALLGHCGDKIRRGFTECGIGNLAVSAEENCFQEKIKANGEFQQFDSVRSQDIDELSISSRDD